MENYNTEEILRESQENVKKLNEKLKDIESLHNEIKEYKRIEEETKVYHEENIQKLKTTLNNAKNAKKIDYNDSGNLDDDYLLKALE